MRNITLIATRARAMRKSMSPPEVLLWTRLRGRSPDKPTFRRQHPIGSIIVDFYCPSARLAVEVDGSSHWGDQALGRDEARDQWLWRQGVAVLRVPASEVFQDPGGVADGILRFADERRSARPAPLSVGSMPDWGCLPGRLPGATTPGRQSVEGSKPPEPLRT
ncbi:endonuclease domain-containing protein, partial [Phenylobacterium sp.]|uniref:endonuclease domain-containing protein n=1 Tax=Phenylobacterium sp. TaxID=1871053 RepID=UPI0037CCA9DC